MAKQATAVLRLTFAMAFMASALHPLEIRADDSWTTVGATGRPEWVSAKAERRLRLLPALPQIETKIQSAADSYFKDRGPGMGVGLVLDDGLFYSQGFGFKDAAKTAAPNEWTVFRWGSVSKVITAVSFLTLANDPGISPKVSPEDAANENRYAPELDSVCPEFNVPCPRHGQHLGIKIKHILSHTAGLGGVLDQSDGQPWIEALKSSWLMFPPASQAGYSAVGSELLAVIEERISGKKYPKFVHDNLFEPLGMNHSTMDPTSLNDAGHAQFWRIQADHHGWSFSAADVGDEDLRSLWPAGALSSSVNDMSRFVSMWLSGKIPSKNGHPILTPAPSSPPPLGAPVTLKNRGALDYAAHAIVTPGPAATCPSPDANGDVFDSHHNSYPAGCGPATDWGVGWFVGAPPYIGHNGAIPGVAAANTVLDIGSKMAAVGAVSTEGTGVTAVPKGVAPPPGLVFSIDDVVQHLLDDGKAADGASSWNGRTLPTGVARVLFLSGKSPAASDLGAFLPSFVSAHQLTAANVVAFLNDWHAQVGSCSTFRVQRVSAANQIHARFRCEQQNWEADVEVENTGAHRISWVSADDKEHEAACEKGCATQNNACMAHAHGSGDHQGCIHVHDICMDMCSPD